MSWFSTKSKDSEKSQLYEPVKECCKMNGKGTGRRFRRNDEGNYYMTTYEYYRCKKCGHTWEVAMYND